MVLRERVESKVDVIRDHSSGSSPLADCAEFYGPH